MDTTSIVFLLSLIGLLEAIGCPPGLGSCDCTGQYYIYIHCKDIRRPEELISPLRAIEKYKTEVQELKITYSSLMYFPDNIFRNTHINVVEISDSSIMSLSESNTAFNGLEDILRAVTVKNVESISLENFEQIRNIRNLRFITISRTLIGAVDHPIPHFPKLFFLELNSAEISYITDGAFTNLPKLQWLELKYNEITEMKRSMLPNPANDLTTIKLSGNRLYYLPHDFFVNMPKLNHVDLEENEFQTLTENPFSVALQMTEWLLMRDNPLRCDCRIQWIVNKRYPDVFNAHCASPKSLADKSLSRLNYESLWCL